jgi:hypothetical protein
MKLLLFITFAIVATSVLVIFKNKINFLEKSLKMFKFRVIHHMEMVFVVLTLLKHLGIAALEWIN